MALLVKLFTSLSIAVCSANLLQTNNSTRRFCINCSAACLRCNATDIPPPISQHVMCVNVSSVGNCISGAPKNLSYRALSVVRSYNCENAPECSQCMEVNSDPATAPECEYGRWNRENIDPNDNGPSFCNCNLKEPIRWYVKIWQKHLTSSTSDEWHYVESSERKIVTRRSFVETCNKSLCNCDITGKSFKPPNPHWCTSDCYAGYTMETAEITIQPGVLCPMNSSSNAFKVTDCKPQQAKRCDNIHCKELMKQGPEVQWSEWSNCTLGCLDFNTRSKPKSVFYGTKTRTRNVGSASCSADTVDTRPCNLHACVSKNQTGCFFTQWTHFATDPCLQISDDPPVCTRKRFRWPILVNTKNKAGDWKNHCLKGTDKYEEEIPYHPCPGSCVANYTRQSEDDSGLSKGQLIGVAIGVCFATLLIIALLVGLAAFFVRRRHQKKENERQEELKKKYEKRKDDKRKQRKRRRAEREKERIERSRSRTEDSRSPGPSRQNSGKLIRSGYERVTGSISRKRSRVRTSLVRGTSPKTKNAQNEPPETDGLRTGRTWYGGEVRK